MIAFYFFMEGVTNGSNSGILGKTTPSYFKAPTDPRQLDLKFLGKISTFLGKIPTFLWSIVEGYWINPSRWESLLTIVSLN